MYQINFLEFHELCLLCMKFRYVGVFQGLNNFVLECIFHVGVIFACLVLFSVYLVGLLAMCDHGLLHNGQSCYRDIWLLPWCSHLHYSLSYVLHCQFNMGVFLACHIFGRVVVFAYIACIIFLRDPSYVYPLIVGRLFIKNLVTILLILFGFIIVNGFR